jgi:hypothetical protein
MWTGCPFCNWKSYVFLDGALGAHEQLTSRLSHHVVASHGLHCWRAIDDDAALYLIVGASEERKPGTAKFRHAEGTRYNVVGSCARCGWQNTWNGYRRIDNATATARAAYAKHSCSVPGFHGVGTYHYGANPEMHIRLEAKVVPPSSQRIVGLASPPPAEDQMTFADVGASARWAAEVDNAVKYMRQAANRTEKLVDASVSQDECAPAPIPPREVVETYVKTIQEMTSTLALQLAGARPNRHELYSRAIASLVSATEDLSDLGMAL